MTPEQINEAHGKPTWKCRGCQSESGLHWHNGWSVAMCMEPECAAEYAAMCRRQEDEQAAFEAHCKEIYG